MDGQNTDDVHEMQKPVEELQERCSELGLPGEEDAEEIDGGPPIHCLWMSSGSPR